MNQVQNSSGCYVLLYNIVKQRLAYRSNCTYNKQNRTVRFARSIRFLNLPAAVASVMNQLHAMCGSPGCSGSGLHCQARLRLEHALQRFYKFTEFRPRQLEAMLSVLHCKDVFVRMATGSGKSLCMFLPPLAISDSSLAVIISPLIGLMDQQVRKLVCLYVSMICSLISG